MSVIIFYNCQIDAIKIKGKGGCPKKIKGIFQARNGSLVKVHLCKTDLLEEDNFPWYFFVYPP